MRLNYCVRLNAYCSAGVKKGLLVFGCEFVHLIPTRRKNAISMLSALSNTSAAFGRFGSRDFDRRGFNARPLERLLREPRRIEILDQQKIAHFQSDVAYYRWLYTPLFCQEEWATLRRLCRPREQWGCIGAHNPSRRSDLRDSACGAAIWQPLRFADLRGQKIDPGRLHRFRSGHSHNDFNVGISKICTRTLAKE